MTYKRFHNTDQSRDPILRIRRHDLGVGNAFADCKAAQTEKLDVLVIDFVALF